MEISFGLLLIIFSFSTLFMQLNEVYGQNLAKKCQVLSPEDVNRYQCGKQFVEQEQAYNSNNASIVELGEFPW